MGLCERFSFLGGKKERDGQGRRCPLASGLKYADVMVGVEADIVQP